MAFDAHKNLAYGTVATAPSPGTSGTSLELSPGEGALLPAAPFNATVWAAGEIPLTTNAEIVRVTNVAGDVLTITRAQEGTVARDIQVGDQFAATITAKTLTDVEDAIDTEVADRAAADIVLSAAIAGKLSAVRISAGASSANVTGLTFSNASGVSFGLSAGTITATVATNYQSAGAYLTTAALSQDSSKYGGTNGAITGGSLTLNTSGLSISLPPYLTTAMQSDAVTISNIKVSAGASSTYLSALTFSNSNGLAFGLSDGTVTGSYTVPTVPAQFSAGVSTGGNTAGDTGAVTGRLILAGGNNITISGSTNGGSLTLTISGPNVAGAQTGISGVVVSDATYTSGTLYFSNAGNVTINSSVNGASQYIRLSGNAAQTTQSAIKGLGVSDTGQTAGNTGLSTGIDWVLAGSNSITLSQSTVGGGPNTIWFQHPAWLTTAALSADSSKYARTGFTSGGAGVGISGTLNTDGLSLSVTAPTQTNQTVGLYASSNTYLTSSGTVDARSLSFRGDKSISVGISNGEVAFSVGAYLTTAMASNAVTLSNIRVSAGATSNLLSAITFANSNGLAFGISDSTITGSYTVPTVPAQLSVGVSTGGNTAGNTGVFTGRVVFAGGNNVTLSGSSNAGSATVTVSVGNYLTTARASNDAIGLNTAKTNVTWTVNSSGLSFDAGGYAGTGFTSGGANVSLSGTQNTAGLSLSVSVAAQTNQSLGLYAVGNTTGESSSTTLDARTVSYKGLGIASVGYSNSSVLISVPAAGASINISAGTTSGNLNAVTFSNSGGISFGLNAGTITASASTVGTATTVYSVASANSVGTVTRWAAEDHRHAGIGAIGISTGNTSGTSGSVLGTYWIAGSNGVSVSQITSNNGSHTLNVYGVPHQSYYAFAPLGAAGATLTTSVAQSTSMMMPFQLPLNHSFDRLRLLVSGSVAASSTQATTGNTSLSMTYVTSHNLVIYSRGTGASSLSLQYVTSTQIVDQVSMRISYAANSTQYSVSLRFSLGSDSFTKDYSVSQNSIQWHTSNITDLTGVKYLDVPFGVSLSPGQYWLGYGRSTNSATQANSVSVATRLVVSMNSMIGLSQNTLALGMLGGATNSSVAFYPALGSYTTSGAAGTTSSVEMSAVSSMSSNNLLHAQLMRF